jgi:beta-galactosidase/beta-glucuronidase
MTHAEETLHPRPQMARPAWLDLRGPWEFAYDDNDYGIQERWQSETHPFTREITVPFPPESPASGIHDPGYHPVVWYRRVVEVGQPQDEGRILLHFGAVDYRAQVWVNGHLVADHEGGNTPFSADITDTLTPDGKQVIVVRAVDEPLDLTQPRGKQDWREVPHEIWYNRTTGIWQPVWMEIVGPTYVKALRWTPDLDRGVLRMSMALRRRTSAPVHVRVELSLRGSPLVSDVCEVYGQDLRRDLALDLGSTTMSREDVLWSPKNPNLIDARVTVLTDDQVTDEVISYTGLRSVDVSGGRFLLNGEPYYLRMVLEQGYWPESHLAAPGDEAIRREVELAKELGFNGVRIHQKVEDPRYLYWCDRLGVLVWGEMANAYVFARGSIDRFTREWLEVLEHNANHPSIVAWVPLNESWGVPNLLRDPAQQHYVQAIFHLTKSVDPTRPVVGNDGWEYLCGDIFGIHDYTPSGQSIRERYGSAEAMERTLREVQPGHHFVSLSQSRSEGTPVMITEFGGISYRPAENEEWFGYSTVGTPEDYLRKYEELITAVLDCGTLSGFCYTQFTDTGQETNGLLTADRRPKLDPALIRDINRGVSMAVPADIIQHLRQVKGSPFRGTVREQGPEDEHAPA